MGTKIVISFSKLVHDSRVSYFMILLSEIWLISVFYNFFMELGDAKNY